MLLSRGWTGSLKIWTAYLQMSFGQSCDLNAILRNFVFELNSRLDIMKVLYLELFVFVRFCLVVVARFITLCIPHALGFACGINGTDI